MFGDTPPLTPQQRNLAYGVNWVGGACAVALVIWHLLDPMDKLNPIMMGGAAGGLIASIVPSRQDEFFQRLCENGARWTTAFMGLFLFVSFIAIGLHDNGKANSAVSLLLNDAILIGCLAACTYYLGFAVAWWRNR